MKNKSYIIIIAVLMIIAATFTSMTVFAKIVSNDEGQTNKLSIETKSEKTTGHTVAEAKSEEINEKFEQKINEDEKSDVKTELPEKCNSSIETQSEAYHKCLNTIDYFNTASGHVIAKFDGNDYDLTFATDMINERAYQHFIDNKGNDLEEYFFNSQMTRYNNVNQTFLEMLYRPTKKADAISIEDSQRLRYDGPDGEPCFYYRADPTNITQSCVSLFPQAMTAGLLNDFSTWSLDGKIEYAKRTCAVIKGRPANGIYKGIASFTLYVDDETGIWIYAEGVRSDGSVVFSLETTEITIDQPVDIIFNEETYIDYKNARG